MIKMISAVKLGIISQLTTGQTVSFGFLLFLMTSAISNPLVWQWAWNHNHNLEIEAATAVLI